MLVVALVASVSWLAGKWSPDPPGNQYPDEAYARLAFSAQPPFCIQGVLVESRGRKHPDQTWVQEAMRKSIEQVVMGWIETYLAERLKSIWLRLRCSNSASLLGLSRSNWFEVCCYSCRQEIET